GNLPAAAERWQTAADIVKEAAGPDHPMRGSLLSDLGGLTALGLENPDEGEPLMLEGLAILEKTHGPKAPELVEVLMDLAKTKLMLGDPAAAEPYATRALAIVDEAFEGKHPRRADPRMPMADIFAATGRFEQAQALLNEALEILDDPKTHPMQRADVQFALARALAPTDADAAGAMADAAIAGIADFEPGKPLRDAIEGWRGAVLNGGEHPPT
ncbi:MAG: tetratricopeptide repeat protein, partial [Myxococcota bacterium]